jgi:hypothetical protein
MGHFETLRVFALGALGGSLVELLRWWKLREATAYPVYIKKPGYWGITILMILAGGLMAALYGLDATHAAALVNIGASTPAILGALASKPDGSAPTALPTVPPTGLGEKSFKGPAIKGVSKAELVRRFLAFGS